jgi:hypothetical protein
MNESTFRSLFRKAIGEPEAPVHLSTQARLALKESLERQPTRLREGLAVLAALVVAFAVVATLLMPRLFTHVQQAVGTSSPSASPAPVATSPSPDPNACRLPVVVEDDTNLTMQLTAGFIDVASGHFAADQKVSFADLPHVASIPKDHVTAVGIDLLNAVYDPVVKRWLPSSVVSPDQLSYVYVTVNARSSEMHIYDLVQHNDRIVSTFGAAIGVSRWTVDGIYASIEPFASGNLGYWRVDPLSGRATAINKATFNPYASLISGPGSFGVYGADPEHALYTVGGRNPGTRYTDFVIIEGKRTNIYSGVNGDRMDFDPVNVGYDGPRLWFSNYDSKYLWSWTAATGLTRHSVQIPGLPDAARHSVVYTIAGPCV